MRLNHDRQVVFFDGVCTLCNAFVDFLIRRDKENLFDFAPLQGSTARRALNAETTLSLASVVLWSQGETFQKSDAALLILQQLGGAWGAVRVLWILPKLFRDWVYDRIAKNRYRIWGRRDTCRLPSAAERNRFLD